MIRAELLKVRLHSLPWLVYGALAVALVMPALVLATSAGDSFGPADFTDVAVLVNANVSPLLVIVFGAWMAANEYRRQTWRVVLGRDPRRTLHLTSKIVVFVAVMVIASLATFAVGLAAMAAAAAAHSTELDLSRVGGEAAFVLLAQATYGLVAFGVAVVTRSLAAGISVVLVYYVIVDALLGFIDAVRPYLLGPALGTLADEIVGASGGVGAPGLGSDPGLLQAVAVVVVYPLAVLAAAYVVFMRRDITD